MKRTAILIDDDIFMHHDVPFRLKGIPQLDVVGKFLSVDDAKTYFEGHPEGVDVIFCDVLMPDKDGYEANKLLFSFCRLFVFLSQKKSYGKEIYGTVSTVHYMRKPLDPAAVSLLLTRLDGTNTTGGDVADPKPFLFLNDRLSQGKVFVHVADILMVSIQLKYGEVTLADKKDKLLISGSLVTFAAKLKAAGWFIRISQSCIISAHAIKHIDKNLVVYFTFGGYQAVGRTYQQAFRTFINKHGLG